MVARGEAEKVVRDRAARARGDGASRGGAEGGLPDSTGA